jgi:hypothetical protein
MKVMVNFQFTKYKSNNPNDPMQRVYENINRHEAWRFKFFLIKAGLIAFIILVLAGYILVVNLAK